MARRFPIDPAEAIEADDVIREEAPRTRKRPSDKRWKRLVSDKSPRPGIGASPHGEQPDGDPHDGSD